MLSTQRNRHNFKAEQSGNYPEITYNLTLVSSNVERDAQKSLLVDQSQMTYSLVIWYIYQSKNGD